jgi:flagellar biosynthesis/type III secretory pathway protein FliH
VPAADDAFVSLERILRGEPANADVAVRADPLEVAAVAPAAAAVPESAAATAELLRDVRRFRARLSEAFDGARAALVHELAYAVLGRELQLSAPDVAQIALRMLAEHPAAQALHVRVAPADLAQLEAHAAALPPIVADATLAPGDIMLELACGHIDARLGVRLAAVLAHGA